VIAYRLTFDILFRVRRRAIRHSALMRAPIVENAAHVSFDESR
jgi:hypothetical protein